MAVSVRVIVATGTYVVVSNGQGDVTIATGRDADLKDELEKALNGSEDIENGST